MNVYDLAHSEMIIILYIGSFGTNKQAEKDSYMIYQEAISVTLIFFQLILKIDFEGNISINICCVT